MSTNAETDRNMGGRAIDALGQALGFVAGGAALVLLWVFALTGGTRGRVMVRMGRKAP